MVNVRQFDVDVLLNFKSNSNNLKDFNKVVSKDMVTNAKAITSSTIDATGYLKKYNQEQVAGLSLLKQKRLLYLDLNKAQKKEVKLNKQMDFGFLSQIFGGMALQRTFGGVFKGIINGYRDASDKNSEFNIGVNKLSGAFTYLKFTIGNAFAENPAIQQTLDVIIDGVTRLGKWFEDNPDIATLITTLSGALFVLGSTSFVFGTFKSVIMGISKTLLDFSGILGFLATKLSVLSKLGFLLPLLTNPITVAIALILGLGFVFSKFSEKINGFLDKFGLLGDLMRIVGNIFGILFNSLKFGFNWLVVNIPKVISFVANKIKAFIGLLMDIPIIGDIFKLIGKGYNWVADKIDLVADKTQELNENTRDLKIPTTIDLSDTKIEDPFKDYFQETELLFSNNELPNDYSKYISNPINSENEFLVKSFNPFIKELGGDGNTSIAIKSTELPSTFRTNISQPIISEIDRVINKMNELNEKISSNKKINTNSIYNFSLPNTPKSDT